MPLADVVEHDLALLTPGQRARLRWFLQTLVLPENPRTNQLTPGTHTLCKQDVRLCNDAIRAADELKLRGEERITFLHECGHIDWLIWIILSGRGWGKTRVGAEDMAHYARQHPKTRLAMIGPTFGDVRDTMVEGESGLLAVLHPLELRGGSVDSAWNRSMGELILENGARFKAFSADKPERLRGPQHHRAWCDEMAAWQYLQDTWDMLMFGLRLGDNPQVIVTTTPRPKKLVKELIKRPTSVVVRGSTFDNARNLSPATLAELRARYGGTRLGRQELEGEVLEDVEGALWMPSWIDRDRRTDLAHLAPRDLYHALDFTRVVIGVDPAMTSGENADETGIIVAGLGADGHGYVLRDRSARISPMNWGRRVVNTYREFMADRVVPETNNGGELVISNIKAVDENVPVKGVHASKGKRTRAEPVANLYEQGRVHHVGEFNDLEDQMCNWVPDAGDDSPDRMDALVYALTELMLRSHTGSTEQTRDGRLAGRR